MGALALLLLVPAVGRAEESNPNNYSCLGSLSAGAPVEGSEEQQVQYGFYCDGPITGYSLQTEPHQIQYFDQAPVVALKGIPQTADGFSCSGEIPGYAVNCVGAAKQGYETITGQFSIEHNICAEPREDPLLTVVFATIEKSAVVQAISGPFDLGRPLGCKADQFSGGTRLNPKAVTKKGKKHKKSSKKKSTKKKGKKAAHKAAHTR